MAFGFARLIAQIADGYDGYVVDFRTTPADWFRGKHVVKQALRQAYAECARLTRKEAKNFYYAFLTLPPARRRAIYAVYSFCRLADDAADLAPTAQIGQEKIWQLRHNLSDCLSGRPKNLVFLALADAQRRFNLQPDYLHAILAGVEQDLTVTRYADFAMLRSYCWKVASAVGLLSLDVFGYHHPSARQHAEDLGLAMQLTNILRDVKEDLAIGRIYLPQDEMAAFGVTEEQLVKGEQTANLQRFIQYQVQRARQLFASGAKLAPLVYWQSRPCPTMLQAVYSRILDQIEAAEYNVFARRISLSQGEKAKILIQTWSKWLLHVR